MLLLYFDVIFCNLTLFNFIVVFSWKFELYVCYQTMLLFYFCGFLLRVRIWVEKPEPNGCGRWCYFVTRIVFGFGFGWRIRVWIWVVWNPHPRAPVAIPMYKYISNNNHKYTSMIFYVQINIALTQICICYMMHVLRVNLQ
jgi:hypothetical protein